jgi:hypothetical protein
MVFVMKEARAMSREIGMTLDDWRELARREGWKAVWDRQREFAYQWSRVWERARLKQGVVHPGEFYAMQHALTEAARVKLEEPGISAERRQEVQKQILVMEQMNSQLREIIALWQWRRGELHG